MADVSINEGVLKQAVELGQKLGTARSEGVEIPYAVLPVGSVIHSLLAQKFPYGLPARKPEFIKQTVTLTDAKSFCEYVSLFSDRRTRIFANPEEFSFLGVLDFHGAPQLSLPGDENAVVQTPSSQPDMLAHRASFRMRSSAQWNIWIGQNEKEIPQAQFAEFIEDNYRDIKDPSPALMLEVARDLTAHVDVNFSSKVTPRNGSSQLAYQEVVQAGVGESGKVDVPERFAICIPVFYGEQPVLIEARLRFRINGGKLKFIFKLYRPAEVQSGAFDLAATAISDGLETQVLMGSL